jgi:hypothetical protein
MPAPLGAGESGFVWPTVTRRVAAADPVTAGAGPRTWRRRAATHAERFGLHDDDVLCRTPRATLLRRDYYNRHIWKPAIAAAGLPGDATFHDLRHTFASTALAEGVPISEVSRWLGHKSITTTVDLYSHLVPEAAAGPATRWTMHSASRRCAPKVPPPFYELANAQLSGGGGG